MADITKNLNSNLEKIVPVAGGLLLCGVFKVKSGNRQHKIKKTIFLNSSAFN
jgi:hypothetical protein